MNHSESAEQRAYFDWAALHPHARDAFAVPNGGRRNKREAARMKGEGVRAGVPDVCLPKMRGGCGALWLELKAEGGSTSKAQRERLQQLAADGYAAVVAFGAECAIAATTAYLAGRLRPGVHVLRRTSELAAIVA